MADSPGGADPGVLQGAETGFGDGAETGGFGEGGIGGDDETGGLDGQGIGGDDETGGLDGQGVGGGDETGGPGEQDIGDSDVPLDDQAFSGADFTVYFIDVGQADSTLIVCEGETMLIDGGNVGDSSLIYSFLKSHDIAHLDYMIGTHPHEDHIGGLAGALNFATVGVAYCPVAVYDSKAFRDFVKYLEKQDVSITIPSPGEAFSLGRARVEIVGPVNRDAEPNNLSIIARVSYGDTSFLFTGDAEREEEADVLSQGYDLESTLLHVGHHGSDTSSSYPFLREVMPEYAVISVGENNSYGHPDENLLSRLRDVGAVVYRTDMQGTITCKSDGKTLSFETEKAVAQTKTAVEDRPGDERKATSNSSVYIGNKNSKKFHLPTCKTLPKEENRVYFDSRQTAVNEGYAPCKNCNP